MEYKIAASVIFSEQLDTKILGSALLIIYDVIYSYSVKHTI